MDELEKTKIQLQAYEIKLKQRDKTIKEQEGKIKELQEKIELFEREIINAISPEEGLRIFEKQFHSVKWNKKNGFL
ncbi:hypothetical protein [Bacillus sp. UNC438CL73TsuS30]|uniref:hypothetical protein n=1 Tax=Bacillus sp. UNC438CL73TsuS30 TaxID=1340434 RepID=UPI0004796B92|nr:hypothetical protein [Bacillus sp. UNC438CL73TsuS30]